MLISDSLTQLGWEQGSFGCYLRRDALGKLMLSTAALQVIKWIGQFRSLPSSMSSIRSQRSSYSQFDMAPTTLRQLSIHDTVPRDRYKANLSHLVQMVKLPTSAYYSPETRMILITPSPMNTKQRGKPKSTCLRLRVHTRRLSGSR
ncbi:hypothetical protein F4604DRAFT_407382 [Suillus subluteus]|nr:hypothetical protein F4604DRAFT_407382 [Suillus subluteus]